jgi:hypothetical protein
LQGLQKPWPTASILRRGHEDLPKPHPVSKVHSTRVSDHFVWFFCLVCVLYCYS